ncbi:hypothetical protein CERZMDRAFT_99808 [Cercospora zeae-maydis SCOH1-5]|uniref:Apple domain-containing protein n=1 Tax=Cercospora zeae-maydis SCOH1-5 TaxID=717836 RepID=A0A6A6F9P1_9PEZI|nr:hypothetical protein CERZMDRAFT_99808 [Cercospora zeae-maydis SCOH1-5]
MRNIFDLALALPILVASAAAQSMICRTTMGTVSVRRVSTVTTTSYYGRRPTQVLVNQRTITSYQGIVSTSVVTRESTETVEDPTQTETATVSSTAYDVQTISNTITNTVPTTTTRTETSTSTTIVPTAAGFAAISDTINRGPVARREPQHPHGLFERQSKNVGVNQARFPKNVGCTRWLPKTQTYTTYTNLPAQTNIMQYFSATTTSTSIIPVTETIFPEVVTETETQVSTMTVQSTTTLFTTSMTTLEAVATQVLNGPTFYDACKDGSRNFFGPNVKGANDPFDDYYIVNILNNGPNVGNSGNIVSLNGINTKEQCCSRCQASPICESFAYRRGSATCFLLSHADNTCSAQNQPVMLLTKAGSDNGAEGYTVGNGKCGFSYSSNSQGALFAVNPR